ncbi:flagellar hook-basal body complex protein FliE [Phycisphaerales bacterium AB-hyl4]|uniref:Flagellar hook-basal body complex protein FliE n=1 Tax=Natronomicrosphaera hydrolytica TaxID=3242702 RepID=A0ABV4U802_9BACT
MADPLGLISSNPGAGGVSRSGPSAPKGPTASDGASPEFKDVMMKHIEQVNRLQQDADTAIEDLVSGRRDDMDAVLMAKQKADVAFQMLLQVRNKMMDAYEEVKQIRV